MGTAELHYLLGRYCAEWERKNKLKDVSVLAAAYRAGVPCYTSSPGDSTIGMNVAGVELVIATSNPWRSAAASTDVPLARMTADFARLYPRWLPQRADMLASDFLAEAARETGR